MVNGFSLVLRYNHLSGNLSPFQQEGMQIKRWIDVGKSLDLPVLDFLSRDIILLQILGGLLSLFLMEISLIIHSLSFPQLVECQPNQSVS